MQILYHNVHETRSSSVATVLGQQISFGQAESCDIVLDSPFVSPVAGELSLSNGQWQLRVLNENGCSIDGLDLDTGRTVTVPATASFTFFPFHFTLDPQDATGPSDDDTWRELEDRALNLVKNIHVELLNRMNLSSTDSFEISSEYVLRIERNLEVIAGQHAIASSENRDLVQHLAGHCVRGELIDRTLRYVEKEQRSAFSETAGWSELKSLNQSQEAHLHAMQQRVASELDLVGEDQLTERMQQLDAGFRTAWQKIGSQVMDESLLYLALRQLKKQIKDIVFGYGPLEDMLRLPTISEVMVLGSDRIYVERDGVIENSGRRFVSDHVTLAVIDRIVSKVGRRIDKSQPIADARLIDGSRVNAVIPPIALDGPLLTVRKFPTNRLTIPELIASESLTEAAATFLEACVVGRRNVLISGGTGTGKTTLLNCLGDYIPDNERIVTIEDTAELRLAKKHVARMETKSANIEGSGAYEISDLVRNSLRMRPDRVVVGECRGKEALWMLQAMNTGHDGCLTTIHANSAADVILRLEVMVQSAADLPVESIHKQVSSAIDVIVQLTRLRNGKRVVSEIAEVLPAQQRDATVRIKQIFKRETNAPLMPTGQMPSFMESLIGKGLLSLDALYV